MKTIKIPTTLLTVLIAATSLQAVELLTSDGAWDTEGINNSSNSGAQTNSNNDGKFVNWGGVTFNSNSENNYFDMQATKSNPQQSYAAGYTYYYRSTSVTSSSTVVNQVAYLTADGSTITASRIFGPNSSNPHDPSASHTISDSFVVATGDNVVGQTIGLRLSSEGAQSRFRLNGNDVNALLTNHAGFDGGNGVGALYSTSFSDGAQVTAFDHVLDMHLTNVGGAITSDFFRINNDSTFQNTISFGSETDTFRTGTSYQISIVANQALANDSNQNSIKIVMGDDILNNTYTETITMSANPATYTFTVDVDDKKLAGAAFRFEISASSLTSGGATNQYRIYEFKVSAIP
jgi:hypothetical protein